jgi:hypothetical protein
VDSQSRRTRPAPLVEQSTSSDFITCIFHERLQRASAAIQHSCQNPTTSSACTVPHPQPQPIPAQQQHRPVLPDSTNQYFELSTATGRVFKHTICYNTVRTPTLCKPDTSDRPLFVFSFNLLNLATPLLSYAVRLVLPIIVPLSSLLCYLYDAVLILTSDILYSLINTFLVSSGI